MVPKNRYNSKQNRYNIRWRRETVKQGCISMDGTSSSVLGNAQFYWVSRRFHPPGPATERQGRQEVVQNGTSSTSGSTLLHLKKVSSAGRRQALRAKRPAHVRATGGLHRGRRGICGKTVDAYEDTSTLKRSGRRTGGFCRRLVDSSRRAQLARAANSAFCSITSSQRRLASLGQPLIQCVFFLFKNCWLEIEIK